MSEKTAGYVALAGLFGASLFLRLGVAFIGRLFEPPHIATEDAEDYAEEYAGVVTTRDRPTPTMRERVPGIVMASVLVALSLVVCVAFWHQLGFLGVLLVVAAVFLGADTARVLTARRLTRDRAAATGSKQD